MNQIFVNTFNLSNRCWQMLWGNSDSEAQKNQRKFYSEKKKHHMMKFEIMTDTKGKILNISKGYRGWTHDFKIWKMSDHVPKDVQFWADSGYQGLQKQHPKTLLLHKLWRKVFLSEEQKEHNNAFASKRVSVEHVFSQLKKFKILGSIYRNFHKKITP